MGLNPWLDICDYLDVVGGGWGLTLSYHGDNATIAVAVLTLEECSSASYFFIYLVC